MTAKKNVDGRAAGNGAKALHSKPDVICPACGDGFRPSGIGGHRKKCDPTWTPGYVARRQAERSADTETWKAVVAAAKARREARIRAERRAASS